MLEISDIGEIKKPDRLELLILIFKHLRSCPAYIDAIAQSTKHSMAKPVSVESTFLIKKAMVLIERAQSTEAKRRE